MTLDDGGNSRWKAHSLVAFWLLLTALAVASGAPRGRKVFHFRKWNDKDNQTFEGEH